MEQLNTKISYRHQTGTGGVQCAAVLPGQILPSQIDVILSVLEGGIYFMPESVGLPTPHQEGIDPEKDHSWSELTRESFSLVEEEPTVQMTPSELTNCFASLKLPKGQIPVNTKIQYLYRDAANYKVTNTVIIPGRMTEEQIKRILATLDEGEYFQPHKVGLPEKRFDKEDPELDHPWFELTKEDFSETTEAATLQITPRELVRRFEENSKEEARQMQQILNARRPMRSHQVHYAPNQNITMTSTGDPALDTLLQQAFCAKHPSEAQFPVGCQVVVTMDLPSLTEKLHKDMKISRPAAKGVALHLQQDPTEVISIEDLVDDTGTAQPYASLMDNDGYMYVVNIKDLRKVQP